MCTFVYWCTKSVCRDHAPAMFWFWHICIHYHIACGRQLILGGVWAWPELLSQFVFPAGVATSLRRRWRHAVSYIRKRGWSMDSGVVFLVLKITVWLRFEQTCLCATAVTSVCALRLFYTGRLWSKCYRSYG